jgi:hypothetical protein
MGTFRKKYGSERLQKAMKIMMDNYMQDMKKNLWFRACWICFPSG